jgi:TatA/E family protein of Tat protein translocase
MMGLSPVHLLIFGIVAVLLFGNRLPRIGKSLRQSYREFRNGIRELRDQISIRDQQRGSAMREHFKKFLWTSKFWAMLGVVGLVSGLYFQRVAANGSGLWCLGLMFLGAAYLEQQE